VTDQRLLLIAFHFELLINVCSGTGYIPSQHGLAQLSSETKSVQDQGQLLLVIGLWIDLDLDGGGGLVRTVIGGQGKRWKLLVFFFNNRYMIEVNTCRVRVSMVLSLYLF